MAKRKCWHKFLLRVEELEKKYPAKIHPENKNLCWKVLKYTKPKTNCTTPALQDLNNQVAVTMQAKKVLVKAYSFSKAPLFQGNKYKF